MEEAVYTHANGRFGGPEKRYAELGRVGALVLVLCENLALIRKKKKRLVHRRDDSMSLGTVTLHSSVRTCVFRVHALVV